MRSTSLFLVSAAAALVPLASAQTLTTLGTGIAEAISADGTTVVGSDGFLGAWSWTAGGGQVQLPGSSAAIGVSGDGSTVFGRAADDLLDAGAVWDGVSWTGIGAPSMNGGCPNVGSPYGMDDSGDIAVGLGWDGCNAFAYRWINNGSGVLQLPQLGPNSSRSNDVSGDGAVVTGWDEATNGSRRAAIWFADNTEMLLLPGVGGDPDGAGEAWGVSSDGTWVSGSASASGNAFRWSAATGPEALGTIAGFQGAASGQAISDDGKTVVGFAGIAFFGITAFIWTEADGIQRFQDFAAGLGIILPPGEDFQIISDMTADGRKMIGYYGADAGPFSAKTPFLLDLDGFSCGYFNYGEGLGGADVMALNGSAGNQIGSTFTATTSANPGSVTVTLISNGDASFPIFGGTGLLDPSGIISTLISAPAGGVSAENIPIPVNGLLVGKTYYLQSFADDVTQPDGLALSNGVALTICP